MTLPIPLPLELLKKLKQFAVREDITDDDIGRFLTEYLRAHADLFLGKVFSNQVDRLNVTSIDWDLRTITIEVQEPAAVANGSLQHPVEAGLEMSPLTQYASSTNWTDWWSGMREPSRWPQKKSAVVEHASYSQPWPPY